MIFEPEPGTTINLNGETIEFIPVESSGPAAVFVYAESGKEGVVYKVMKGDEFYALKVFYPDYRDKRLLENTEQLSRFKNLEGFRVAERTVITGELFSELVSQYPELNYAVLMPWVEGTGWGNLMTSNEVPLQREIYFQIARALIKVVSSLETQGLAHCDLSNNNFIIDKALSAIQLIDIEDMYAPDMPRPIPDISYGTIGYRTKWIAEKGLWGPESDRFASAVLCSEILTWHNGEIRENKAGDASFFDDAEIGETSDRYKLMTKYLEAESNELPALLERAWFSTEFNQCPTISEWLSAIQKIDAQTTPLITEVPHIVEDQSQATTIISQKNDETLPSGVPPKMYIDIEILDFGTLDKAENSLQFSILNSGGSILNGTLQPEDWLDISTKEFTIVPGGQQIVKASTNSKLPKPKTGLEYRTPNALTIESNAGDEIIGASYKLEKTPFYKSWWRRTLIGGILGVIIAIFFLMLEKGSLNELIYSISSEGFSLFNKDYVIFMVAGCALAGLISYPHKLSTVFLVLGFVVLEIILFLLPEETLSLLNIPYIPDPLIVKIITLTSFAIPAGFYFGALASRIFASIPRFAKKLK